MSRFNFVPRFFNDPKTSFFLFGPRGTGKSTFLKQKFPDALWIDLLKPENLRIYSAYPERLAENIDASYHSDIVIDEVQKSPKILNVVHSLIEQNKKIRFILTGSSARKLKRSGENLLAGRAVLRYFHPFTAAELGTRFKLEHALQFGLLPLVYSSKNSKEILRTYAGLYLKEEVQTEGMVRNIGDFARFLEIISFSHGEIINLSNIARECSISRKIVEGYLNILQDLLLCYLVPVFSKRAKRQLISHPKFYYFDVGIFRSLRSQGPLDTTTEISGHALESLVLQHLQAWNDYSGLDYKIYYWRTTFGIEVDFILYGPNGLWAIEVKNNKNISTKEVRSLCAFEEDYPEAKLLLLHRGTQKMKIKNVLCIPIEDFLKDLHPGIFSCAAQNKNFHKML